ncbi:MAG: ATP-binding cassette domain-containing protein, partial [Methylobacteriaceae bacterium]|nr:ATP-binding cassette domain-containing protein [Methylobacteriaceae bacterium]
MKCYSVAYVGLLPPAHLREGATRRRGRRRRRHLGARPLGDPVSGAAIRFDDLTLGYDRRPAVHHLSGVIAPGSLTAIVGPNGAGKSTLLKGIVGALRPLGGRVTVADGGRRLAYLPQA